MSVHQIQMVQSNGGIVTELPWRTAFNLNSAEDLVLAMGRMCRYAGQIPVSVLTHSMLVGGLMATMFRESNLEDWDELTWHQEMAKAWTYGMMHDVHETIVGDCVWVEKPDWYRALCDTIDNEVYKKVWLSEPTPAMKRCLKICDLMARWFEVNALGSEKFVATFGTIPEAWFEPEGSACMELGDKFMQSIYGNLSCTATRNHKKKVRPGPVLNGIHWFQLIFQRKYVLAFNGFMTRAWDRQHPLFKGLSFKHKMVKVKPVVKKGKGR